MSSINLIYAILICFINFTLKLRVIYISNCIISCFIYGIFLLSLFICSQIYIAINSCKSFISIILDIVNCSCFFLIKWMINIFNAVCTICHDKCWPSWNFLTIYFNMIKSIVFNIWCFRNLRNITSFTRNCNRLNWLNCNSIFVYICWINCLLITFYIDSNKWIFSSN